MPVIRGTTSVRTEKQKLLQRLSASTVFLPTAPSRFIVDGEIKSRRLILLDSIVSRGSSRVRINESTVNI